MTINRHGMKWSDDETILAFYYYCQIPFGKLHQANPEIIRIASLLGRTPSSVALKMCNLGHFDPELRKRNVIGMSNASKMDAKIVADFRDNWEELSFRAVKFEATLSPQSVVSISESDVLPVGISVKRDINVRLNQKFFRNAVLTSYHYSCCITGIAIPELLIASHIKPWNISDPKTERTNPRNGLCLNALHDKAFDRGLITVLPDYTICVSSKLKESVRGEELDWLLQCDKQKILLPEKFSPDKLFLEYHNDEIFQA